MTEILDQLKNLAKEEGGSLSTLTLMSLPSKVRSIIQLMLRNRGKMTYAAMLESVEQRDESKRLTADELQEILDAMSEMGWLETFDDDEGQLTYQVNLDQRAGAHRRKQAREKTRSRAEEDQSSKQKKRGFIRNLWNKIDSDSE